MADSGNTVVQRTRWRLMLWIALLLAGALALVHRLGDVERLVHTLRHAQPLAIGGALLLQALAMCNQPALYQSLYELLGMPARWRDLEKNSIGIAYIPGPPHMGLLEHPPFSTRYALPTAVFRSCHETTMANSRREYALTWRDVERTLCLQHHYIVKLRQRLLYIDEKREDRSPCENCNRRENRSILQERRQTELPPYVALP